MVPPEQVRMAAMNLAVEFLAKKSDATQADLLALAEQIKSFISGETK